MEFLPPEDAAQVRSALAGIVAEHGPEAISRPATARLLVDLLPDAPGLAELMAAAAQERVAEELRSYVAQGIDAATAARLVTSSFASATLYTPEACTWVVGEVAIALGLITGADQLLAAVSAPSQPVVSAVGTAQPGRPQAASEAGEAPAESEAFAAWGNELARLDHDGDVSAVAFSPDGTQVATASGGSARVFDAASGTELVRLDHDGDVSAVAFSPDGNQLATVSDGSARVFDAATGNELARLDHDGHAFAIAFSPDGTQVVTGSSDSSARVYDAATGSELARVDHDGWVTAVAFSPDGTQVAAGNHFGSARLFDAASGNELARLDTDGWVSAVAFSPDGGRVAACGGGRWAWVFDVASGADLARLEHHSYVGAVAFSPDGTQVATGSEDGSARVFDAASGTELSSFDNVCRVRTVAFSPDGTQLATASDGSKRVSNIASWTELARLDHDGEVRAVAFSPDGSQVATGSSDGSARVFDAASGNELARLDHDGEVRAVAFSADGSQVATGSSDGSARVFDAATGSEVARLDHGSWVSAVAFSAEGARVAARSEFPWALVFDIAPGSELARLDNDPWMNAVAFSADGKRLVMSHGEGSAGVFDAATGTGLASLDNDDEVYVVAFSPDGAFVATDGSDGSARVFDAATGTELARLEHEGHVRAVAFSPDGARVATACGQSARIFGSTPHLHVLRALRMSARLLNAIELRRHSLPTDRRDVRPSDPRAAAPPVQRPQRRLRTECTDTAAVDKDTRARVVREAQELYESGHSSRAAQLYATVRDAFGTAERWGPEYGDFSNNYGAALAESGDLPAAESWFREAERVYREFGAWGALANTWFNLGNVAKYRHDRWTADRQYRMSINLFRALGDQPGVLKLTLAMAAVILDDGDAETVRLLLRQADNLIAQGHGDPTANWSRSFILGRVAVTEGDPAAATAHLRAALEVAERHLGPNYITETVSMLSSVRAEDPGSPSSPSTDELAQLERRFREVPNRSLTSYLLQLATAWERRGNHAEADRLYRECIDTVGLARAAAYGTDKNVLMASLAQIAHRYSRSLLRRGSAGPALAVAEDGQGRSLLDRMFRHQVVHQEGRTVRAVGDSRVFLESPSLNEVTRAARSLSLHVLKFLQVQDTVLGWFVAPDGTVEGWESSSAAGPLASFVEVANRPRLRNDLRAVSVAVDGADVEVPGWDEVEPLLASVYETLLPAGIRARLETETGRLLIIPHMAYYHLPWGFLGPVGGRIGERWEVALAPSIGVFLQLDHRRDPGRVVSSPIAVLAATREWTFDLSGEGRHIVHFPELSGTLAEARLVAGLLGTAPEATGSSVRDLLAAMRAADVVHVAAHGYWHPEMGGASFVLLDEDIDEDPPEEDFGEAPAEEDFHEGDENGGEGLDEDDLRRDALDIWDYRRMFVHIGGPAMPAPQDDNEADDADDAEPYDGPRPGLVTTERIADRITPARLVVLSGCQTGLGEPHPDSYVSLPHGFLIAGAKAVLMTLWPIGDGATVEFFRAFYRQLAAGDSPAAALVQAQRDLDGLLDGWDLAAFVLLGNPFAPVGEPPLSGPTFCGGDLGWRADAGEVLDLNRLGCLSQGVDDIFDIDTDYTVVRSSKHAAYLKYRRAQQRSAPNWIGTQIDRQRYLGG